MKASFKLIAFLFVPVTILILAFTHRSPMFEGKEVVVWFNGVETGQSTPALAAFQKMGNVAVPVLKSELKSEYANDRIKAVWLLGMLGPVASNAIPDLVQSLNDPANDPPYFTLQSLETIAPSQMEDAVPMLLAKLTNSDPSVSIYVADLLKTIEQQRKALNLPVYPDQYGYDVAFIQSSSQRLRYIGVRRLMELSPDDNRIKVTLKSLLTDSNSFISSQAGFYLQTHRR